MQEVVCPNCNTKNTSDSQFCKLCAAALPGADEIHFTKTLERPADRLIPGSVFVGRYRIIEELGKGGMGRVYKAVDIQIKETVAVKLIRSEIAEDEKVLERFSNELKLARKISHKNVCRMYHIEKVGETTFISMEYLEGEDLKSVIRERGGLPEAEVLAVAGQVCEGLAEAHRLGVVHRDLKPQNILIGTDGQAKIMDFGIARSIGAPGVTQTGAIIGTPDYMSPEQADGIEADRRSDIYSLGIILYEMATGKIPFHGGTALGVAMKHRSQLPPDPGRLNPALSSGLRKLILVCLEKDPERRYQTAAGLLSDLGNVRDGLPLGTKVRPRRESAFSRLLSKRWLIPAAAVLAAVVIGLVLWRILPSRTPLPSSSGRPSIAVLYFRNMTGDSGLDKLIASLPYLFSADLEQSKYMTAVPDTTIYEILQDLDLLDAETLTTKSLNDIAKKAGATHLLRGVVTKSDQALRIDASLHETPGMKIVGRFQAAGVGGSGCPQLVDELTPQIKSNFLSAAQIEEDVDLKVETVTTKSPQALALYVEGRHSSDPEKKVELLKKAIEIDPEFAMAYRALALCYKNQLNDRKQSGIYWEKMLEKIDGIPLRERLLILAQDTAVFEKKISLFEELLRYYPDHSLARANLGTEYMIHEHFDKAVEQFEIGIKSKNAENIGSLYSQLSFAYLPLGEYDKLENLVKFIKKEILKEDRFSLQLAYAYAAQGEKALAFSELGKIKEFSKNYRYLIWIGWLYVALGDETEAEKYYRQIFKFKGKSIHLEGWLSLGGLSCFQGKFKKAEEQHREGLKLAEEIHDDLLINTFHNMLALLALRSGDINKALKEIEEYTVGSVTEIEIYAAAKQFDKAQKVGEKLREDLETGQFGIKKRISRELSLGEGLIALEKGDYAEAVKHFKDAQNLLAFPFPDNIPEYAWYYNSLALAYYRSGELENTQQEYTKISKMTLGRAVSWDCYAKSFYMLGKIAEQRGWPGKAIDYYRQFLEIWREADLDIPEVMDAQKRLIALGAE
jgi:serine/threonine protein kinase/Tfp pilus assembly protein PilF